MMTAIQPSPRLTRLTPGERDRSTSIRVGIVGTVIAVLAVTLALQSQGIRNIFTGTTYHADFTEAGGLTGGDPVVVNGLQVGHVESVKIAGAVVEVAFKLDKNLPSMGDGTSASIVSITALGKKALRLVPAGHGRLSAGATIPTDRTTPPYDVTDALANLTQRVEEINTAQLARSMRSVTSVLNAAAPHVRPALDGVARLSAIIDSRDQALSDLLSSSAGFTGVLAKRDQQVRLLIGYGAVLLTALNNQSTAVTRLLGDARRTAVQLRGLIRDNRATIGPQLEQLNTLLRTLRTNRANIDHALKSAAPLVRELGEVVSAFPGFNVYVPNLPPTNLLPGAGALTGGNR